MAAGDITKAMRDRVRATLGEYSQQGVGDAEIYLHMNRAGYDVGWRLADAAIPEMTKRATGSMTSNQITLPSDFWRERVVYIGSALVMAKWWPISQLDALYGIQGSTSTVHVPSATEPYAYIWPAAESAAVKINVLGPAATATYELYYQIKPTDMSASVDPVYSTTTCDAIVMFTVARFREQAKNFPESERVFRQYREKCMVTNSRFAPGKRYEGAPG